MNATAPIPGTMLYTPGAGTVLPAGAGQTLRVDFTPLDSANHSAASKTVTIDVNSAPKPGVNLIVTSLLRRDGTTGEAIVVVTVANTGGTAAAGVKLTSVKIGTATGTPGTIQLGAIAAGGQASAEVRIPSAAGAPGSPGVLTISGTYTGGTFNSATRVVLP